MKNHRHDRPAVQVRGAREDDEEQLVALAARAPEVAVAYDGPFLDPEELHLALVDAAGLTPASSVRKEER